ncbi:MAG: sigma-70 family RNA polymerase sigma factor [Flavobacteriales bacterium]|jgi:RNA polymerase sigma-70 factor (ECF subfamily)|nr:sigma-70 family RNA polymerase sigma factor [Flavobacteriales bacterium]
MQQIVHSDQSLVRRFIAGEEIALERLIARHQERVYSYIRMLVRDESLANDIFQDTFFKVIRTIKTGGYNEEGKFIQWVLRIAHNLSIDHFRGKKRMPTTSGGPDFDIFDILGLEDESIEDKVTRQQILEDVKRMVENLPEEQRDVVKMRMYFEMSFKDIAEETGVSINTALGRMRYALINLRKMMEKQQIQLTLK